MPFVGLNSLYFTVVTAMLYEISYYFCLVITASFGIFEAPWCLWFTLILPSEPKQADEFLAQTTVPNSIHNIMSVAGLTRKGCGTSAAMVFS